MTASDGRGSSFLDFEQNVHLWMGATKTAPAIRASPLVLHMRSAPRQVRRAEGGDALGHHDGVARILGIRRSYVALEAADATREHEMRFAHHRRADQSTDEYLPEFDLLRQGVKSKMDTGAGFPELCISIVRANNAGLPRPEKSLVTAISHTSLKFEEVAANVRRLFGSRGEKSRQDVLLTEEAAGSLGSSGDLDAWAAYGKAKKQGAGNKRGAVSPNVVGTQCVVAGRR